MTDKDREELLVGVPSNLRAAFIKLIAHIEKKTAKAPVKKAEKKKTN